MAIVPSEPAAVGNPVQPGVGPAAPPASRALPKLTSVPAKAIRKRRPRFIRWLFGLVVLAAIAGSVWAATSKLGGFMSHEVVLHIPTQKVHRQDLLITVTEDGNVESAKNVDIRCQVAGGSSILWIIPDGSEVKQGDELVRLNSATIEDQVNQQKILYEKAQATRIDAEKMFSAAKLAVQEYIEGTYIKELQTIEASITIALENLRSAENSLQHTERMARKGYVTPLQLDAQKFAVERAKLDLSAAETSKTVLEKFTKAKMLEDLQSARDSAEARMRSEQAACELELTRLKRLMTQLEQCAIVAPQEGMVVYANEYSSSSRGSSSTVKIEEGALVRERQAIVRLPDLSQMQVKVIVHESKVDSIQPGMRAGITIQDREFRGEVISVANQPEPTYYSSVKEYATVVRIDGHTSGLKPGMTAEVEILVADLKNVLSVPVQAVKEVGNNAFFCWVKTGETIERRPVKIGQSNNADIEIKQGLSEGEDVVLNPEVPAGRDDEFAGEAHVDVASKFGQAKLKTAGRSQRKASLQPGKAGPPQPGPQPAEAGKRVASASAQTDFAQLDRDGNHKISRDEAPDRMREFFPLIDTNHDGSLDAAEMAAARARRSQAGAAPEAGGAR